MGVGKALFAGFDGQRSQIPVGEGAEGRLPDPDHRYRSHIYQLSEKAPLERYVIESDRTTYFGSVRCAFTYSATAFTVSSQMPLDGLRAYSKNSSSAADCVVWRPGAPIS